MNRHWSFFGLLACVAFAPGCGPDIQGVCEAQESCLGGNAADVDACVIVYDSDRDNAYDIGCGEEYDAFVECFSPRFSCIAAGMPCSTTDECNGGTVCVKGECKGYGLDTSNADVCEVELSAYSQCD